MLQIILRENGVEEVVYTASDLDCAIIESHIPCAKKWITEAILNFKYNKLELRQKNLIQEWTRESKSDEGVRIPSKLEQNGITSIPTNKDDLCALIISQPNYKTALVIKLESSIQERRQALTGQTQSYNNALAISTAEGATQEQIQYTADLLAIVLRIQSEIAQLEADLAAALATQQGGQP